MANPGEIDTANRLDTSCRCNPAMTNRRPTPAKLKPRKVLSALLLFHIGRGKG